MKITANAAASTATEAITAPAIRPAETPFSPKIDNKNFDCYHDV